jgi:sulfotransferase
MKYHMITGLPRSGSSLLSSILNQNPRFTADISSPLARFARAIISQSEAQLGYSMYCPESKREAIIRSVFDTYYSDAPAGTEVAFNTNRGWNCLAPLVKQLYPDAKLIVCVRDIAEVLESFERLHQSQPLKAHNANDETQPDNVYTRTMNQAGDTGSVGFAFQCLNQMISNPDNAGLYHIVEYNDLTSDPKGTIEKIYKFIGEPEFEHDFNAVGYDNKEFDAMVGIDGLHKVRDTVQKINYKSILPMDLRSRFEGSDTWRVKPSVINPWRRGQDGK